jgi:hypothetical protein
VSKRKRIRTSAFEIVEEGESRSIIGRDFALVFGRAEGMPGRWTHVIEAARAPGGPREVVARAVEMDAGRVDPEDVSGPVFQELQFQVDPEGWPVALLLGMSGRHHFSASFRLEVTPIGPSIAADVADRCREQKPFSTASNYKVLLPAGELVVCEDDRIAWDGDAGRIAFAAGPDSAVCIADAGRRSSWVGAGPTWSENPGPTRRWRYSWSLTPAAT